MFAEMTVEEQIYFSAQMRLPRTYSKDKLKDRVDRIIRQLGLTEVRNSYVGSATVRGVSGGERKRVTVGIELVTEPSLIFVDGTHRILRPHWRPSL